MSIKMLSQTVLVKNNNISIKLVRFSFLCPGKRFVKITNIFAGSGTFLARN